LSTKTLLGLLGSLGLGETETSTQTYFPLPFVERKSISLPLPPLILLPLVPTRLLRGTTRLFITK
jgi:hypothetical protein